jgi:outer membrane protein TolC
MKTTIKIILIAVFCVSVISLQAQESLVLSLDSAISYALNHNKTLANSKFAIDKSAQKIKETLSQGLPQVNASVDYSNFLGATASLQLNPSAPPAVINFNPTSNFKASASQLLFSGSYYVGVQLSKLGKSAAEQSYQKDELNVKEQVIQAYYMVLASERILTILNGNKANVQLIYEKTQNLANAGMIEQTDAKKLSIMVTSVENAIKSTQRQVEFGYNLLRLQLGIESDQAIHLSTNLDNVALQYIRPMIATDEFNIQKNQDFKLVSMQGEIAQKSIQLKKASYLPTLAAFYSYTEKLKKPIFDMSPKNVLGLTLNIPVFSGGQRLSQLNQAKIDYEISENTKELLTQQLTLQEKQLRYNYNNLFDQYQSQKTNVEITKEVLDKMKQKYQQGIISSLELTSSNTDYLNAESNYTSILLQLINAELSLRKLNSKL